jgi:hypothetical protein
MKRRFIGIAGVILALGCAACSRAGQLVKALTDIQKVQAQVTKDAGTNNVNVRLMNGAYLQIEIVNTSWNDKPGDEKKAKAQEIARSAYAAYGPKAELRGMSVAFVIQKDYLGFFHYSNSTDAYSFDVSGAQASPAPN